MANRRELLEQQLETIQKRIDNLPKEAPEDLLDGLRQERDSISLELNNLYDDPETETE